LSDQSIPDPWDDVPDGALSPFITTEERDQLIVDGTPFRVVSIHYEATQHGPKFFVDIELPGTHWQRTISYSASDKHHPRMAQLSKLAAWLEKYQDGELHAKLVIAGSGTALARP
jgi:hypothetical protein